MTALPHPATPRPDAECPHGGDPYACGPCQRARSAPAPAPFEELVIYARGTARYPGSCPKCGRRFAAGARMALIGPDHQGTERWHDACAEEAAG